MDALLKENKQIIRAFLRENYTDERLAMLLAHARDGKLGFMSCCCFIGIPTADHALRAAGQLDGEAHYEAAGALPGALLAERAYSNLAIGFGQMTGSMDSIRRRRLIPIVKAEMRRRERIVHNERAARENMLAEV